AEAARQEVSLDQEGRGAQALGLFDQLRTVILTEDDDQQVAGGLVLAQRGQQLQPIEVGQVDVEQGDIRLERARHLQSRNAVGRHRDPVAFELQLELIEIGNV